MRDFKRDYAKTILNKCLLIEKGQPLYISIPIERIDFLEILIEEAHNIGVEDIYVEKQNIEYMKSTLMIYSKEELQELPCWNRRKWNEYAEKGSAFLMFTHYKETNLENIDMNLYREMSIFQTQSAKRFNELRSAQQIQWCIAALPTIFWAKILFPESTNPLNDLWNKIFEICGIDGSDNYLEKIDEKMEKLEERASRMNSLKIKKLIYSNELGTNFEIELPNKCLWHASRDELVNGKKVIVNYPTEEMFTSPDYRTANGIVYSSKPLVYQSQRIDEFYIEFKDGKAINCGAKVGEEALKEMINSLPGMNQLGEVALVQYNSPISKSNILFYETLFDENASCHLALGKSFNECIEDGLSKTKEELYELGLNYSDSHIDFMIGTKDMNIKGISETGEEIIIFENGNFSPYFE